MLKNKFFRIGAGILLVFLIIYVGSQIEWVFYPLVVLFQTLFIPIILAGFFYYLLRPVVKLFNKKLPANLSVLIVYIILICLVIGFLVLIGPVLKKQLYSLLDSMPAIFAEIQKRLTNIKEMDFLQLEQVAEVLDLEHLFFELGDLINRLIRYFTANISNIVGQLANTVLSLVIVPFILFYLLRDGDRLGESIINLFREDKRELARSILSDIDQTLSAYIQGHGLVCLCVGLLCYIAFLVIGLDYALLLAVIAGITEIIPYFGPWLGSIPAVIVGLFQSMGKGIIVIIVIIIVQQIESNFITPQVIGKKMKMHPIVIMLLILLAGRLVGLIGMIMVVPLYAVSRVVVSYVLGVKRGEIKM